MLSRAPSRCKCGALARSAPPSARAGARQRATIACAASSAPLQEVDSELQVVDAATPSESFARCRFSAECEASLNEQIAVEYTISYVYHSLYNYFDRDNVGLPGLAAFFKAASAEEREHAEMLMDYQTRRGGRVKLNKLAAPMTEYGDDPKGAALYAMELALSLEKLNFQKLEELNACAVAQKDENLGHWVRTFLLQEQVKSVKEHAMYVAQLRRVGKGLGVYKFDAHIGASAA